MKPLAELGQFLFHILFKKSSSLHFSGTSAEFHSKRHIVPCSKQRHSALWRRKSKSEVRQPSDHNEAATGSEHEQKEEDLESSEEEISNEEEETDVRFISVSL